MSGQGEIPLSAPDVIGPISIVNQPVSGPRSARRQKNRPYAHVHLEVQLKSDQIDPSKVRALQRLENLLGMRKIVEAAGLLRLAGGTLHALSARGFRRVDHWEVSPGGWLPVPPRTPRPGKEETVGHLVKILEGENANAVARARAFSVRLSDFHGNHADVAVLRVHRQHHPAISLDLHGYWTRADLEDLKGALSDRLPVLHTTVTKFQYASEK
jgi:hypothetical protein